MINVPKRIFLLLIILFFTFLAYLPSLKAGFTNWDDDAHVVANPYIRELDGEHLQKIFGSRIARTYIPLSLLTHAVEFHFFQLNPFVYHLNNVLLHLAVVWLVFVFARRFGLSDTASAWAALIFALHPMHVESVAWVSERKDVLCAVLYLLAVLSYWNYLNQRKWLWWVVSVVLGLLSMLAKPMAYSLPLVLFIVDWWTRRKFSLAMLLDKIPHFAYVLFLSWMTLSINKTNLAYSVIQVPLVWMYSCIFYLYKFIVPHSYLAIYKIPEPVTLLNPIYAVSLLAIILTIILISILRRDRLFLFAWVFFVLTISMIIIRSVWDFGNNTVLADRFMYLPSLGFCLWLGFTFDKLQQSKRIKLFINILLCGLTMFLFVKTYQQCLVWKDNLSLWTNVIRHDPKVSRAYINRAQGYLERSQFDLAMNDLNTALIADAEGPKNERLYVARGLIDFNQNRIDAALQNFNQALLLNPYQLDALINRGNVWGRKQEYGLALKDFYAAILVKRESPKAYLGLALVYQSLKDYDKALLMYQEALQLDPQDRDIQRSYQSLQNYLDTVGKGVR